MLDPIRILNYTYDLVENGGGSGAMNILCPCLNKL